MAFCSFCQPPLKPCRLCPHVVVVVELVCVSDPWSYAAEPLMPDRSKVRLASHDQISDQAGHGGLRHVQTVEFRFQDASARQTSQCKRTTYAVTPEENPTSLKRPCWSQQHGRGPISGQLPAKAAGTVQTRYREPGTKSNCRSRRGF